MKQIALSYFPFKFLIPIAMLLFLGAFLMVLIRVLGHSRKEEYDKAKMLPLMEDK